MRTFPIDRYSNRAIGTAHCVSSMDVVSLYLREMRDFGNGLMLSNKKLRIVTEADATYIKMLLNSPGNNSTTLLNIRGMARGEPYQEFEYVKSNLRGYMFYFICNLCGQKVKYLYQPIGEYVFRCRECHGLKYPRKYKRLKSFQ